MLVALAGAFVYAELAARLPRTGGQYAYLREAYHPAVAFAYGWGLLLVIQTGGMAAVAGIFARYFRDLPDVGLSMLLTGLAWGRWPADEKKRKPEPKPRPFPLPGATMQPPPPEGAKS